MNEWKINQITIVNKWMTEWLSEWMSEWMYEWISKCKDERMNKWNESMNETNEWLNEQIKHWVINKWHPVSKRAILNLFFSGIFCFIPKLDTIWGRNAPLTEKKIVYFRSSMILKVINRGFEESFRDENIV